MQIRNLNSLSIVIPMYNEEQTIPWLRENLDRWLTTCTVPNKEVLLVNDGSADQTMKLCSAWAVDCPYIKIVSFSRNYGHQAALSAGLKYATGEAIVMIDADLQDPLEVIPEMIKRYEEGYDVAYGKRTERAGETVFKKATAWLFYRLMSVCTHGDIPTDAGDFRLVSRQCVDAINAMPESHRYLRGMFAWAGFRQIGVPYARAERKYGETKYPLWKMLRLAWHAITSFSTMPIRCISIFGLLAATFGFIACLYALFAWLAGWTVQGWTSLFALISMLGGTTILAVGIVGEYVANIYEEVKKRPLYLVDKTINIDCRNME